jgi:sarcosine oxidase, subunit gamma
MGFGAMAEARAPLADRTADLARLDAVERSFLAQVDVRTADGAALGLPVEPNTWAHAGDREALWLGPDWWLVVGAATDASAMTAELEGRLAGTHHSVVDVSANRTPIELTGTDRLELLSSASPIDLDPRVWTDGRCAQTLFGAAQVLLQERGDATRLFVRPSLAGYVVDLLLAVAER